MRGSFAVFTPWRFNSLEVNMRIPSLSIPVVVLAAMAAGCAMNPSGSTTTAMGAGPARQTVMCRDGAWTVTTADCGNHGGVERAMGTPAAK